MKWHVLSSALIILSVITFTAVIAAEPAIVTISVSPGTLVLGDQGEWVTVHTEIPYTLVDTGADVLLDGINADYLCVDSCGNLVAKYGQAIFKEKYGDCTDPTVIIMVFSGTYSDGSTFTGEDSITVQAQGKNR